MKVEQGGENIFSDAKKSELDDAQVELGCSYLPNLL